MWPKEEQVAIEITCFSVIDHYVVIGTDCGQYALLSFRSCRRVRVRACVCGDVRVRFNVAGHFRLVVLDIAKGHRELLKRAMAPCTAAAPDEPLGMSGR